MTQTRDHLTVDVQGAVRDLLLAVGPWSAACRCGALKPGPGYDWAAHLAAAIVAELSGRELRIVDACDTLAEVADEVALIEGEHGPADRYEVVDLGSPLHGIALRAPHGAPTIYMPRHADDLAAAGAASVAHERVCADAGVGFGPTLHDLLLADVTAALATADDPDRWRQAMVRVAATAVWCASRGQ